jgi:acyl-homoserine-lactone acylase
MPAQLRTDYVANSNESYWLTNPSAPLEGYDRILGGERSIRNVRTRDTLTEITDQLDGAPFTTQSMHDLLYSNRSYSAELARDDTVRMCRSLSGGAGGRPPEIEEPDLAEACEALANWDLRWNVDSRGALLFGLFWERAYFALPDEVLWKVPFDAADPVRTPNTLNTDAPEIRAALVETVQQLDDEGIPLDARLGDHQYMRFGDRKLPIGGGSGAQGVFKLVASDWVPGEGFTRIGEGLGSNSSSYLHIVAFDGDRCPDSRTLLTYSQSADPTSAHDNDQLELFAAGRWVTERFCEDEIRASPEFRAVRLGSKGLIPHQPGDTTN